MWLAPVQGHFGAQVCLALPRPLAAWGQGASEVLAFVSLPCTQIRFPH